MLQAVPAPPLLEVKDLTVQIDTRSGPLLALDHISFNIARGEILGIVGESGAGKSLTGAAIINLLTPPIRRTEGEISLQGARIDTLSIPAMRQLRGKKIGMIFQDPLTSLDPLATIAQQLIETLRAHLPLSPSAARTRAIGLLREVGIPAPEQRIDAYPHAFSGGMRQRVVIALALAAEPELIIADEPTTALDVSVQAQIIELLKALCARRGASIMLITHDMGVIAETADRVAVMYAGRIVEIGPVAQIIQSPRHPYTQGLMGAIPSLGADRTRLTQISGAMPRLTALPEGCAFYPRCTKAMARCQTQRPSLTPHEQGAAACFLLEEVAV